MFFFYKDVKGFVFFQKEGRFVLFCQVFLFYDSEFWFGFQFQSVVFILSCYFYFGRDFFGFLVECLGCLVWRLYRSYQNFSYFRMVSFGIFGYYWVLRSRFFLFLDFQAGVCSLIVGRGFIYQVLVFVFLFLLGRVRFGYRFFVIVLKLVLVESQVRRCVRFVVVCFRFQFCLFFFRGLKFVLWVLKVREYL